MVWPEGGYLAKPFRMRGELRPDQPEKCASTHSAQCGSTFGVVPGQEAVIEGQHHLVVRARQVCWKALGRSAAR